MAADWGSSAAATPVGDWLTAPIPAPPAANHPSGVMMPLRWPHHGDLRILVDGPDVFVSAADLHRLAGIEDPAGELLIVPAVTWSRRPGTELIEFYPLGDVAAVLADFPSDLSEELLAWMRGVIPLALAPGMLDRLTGMESFLHAFTVLQAAHILDGDPAVSIGQRSLFAHLQQQGWIERDLAGIWQPLPVALRNRWLTVRTVSVRAGKRVTPYAQLYITPAGLGQLRRSLHSLHPDAPARPVPAEQLDI